MLTLTDAIAGFRSYLQRLGLTSENQDRYATMVERNLPLQVFYRIPCSRYRPVGVEAVIHGLSPAIATNLRQHWQQFHRFPAQVAGVTFLTMGDWTDAYLRFQQEQGLVAPPVQAARFIRKLAHLYAQTLPLAILDRQMGKLLLDWSRRRGPKTRVGLRHFFRYLQENGLVSFRFVVVTLPRWRREVEALLQQRSERLTPESPLPAVLGAYLHFCLNATNSADSSLQFRYRALRAFVDWAATNELDLTVGQLDRPRIDSYLAYRQTERGNSAVTLRHAVSVLKGLCEFLVTEGVIAHNPLADFVIKLPPPTGPASVLSVAEMAALIAAPRIQRQALLEQEHTRMQQLRLFVLTRDWAILALLCHTGIRSLELRTLTVQSLHRHGYLVVRGKGDRTHVQKERRVYLESAELVEALEAYLEVRPAGHGDTLFLSARGFLPLRSADLGRIVTTYTRAAGIAKPLWPHRLRASFASAMVAEGIDPLALQAMMGHDNLATTLKSYTALEEAQLRAVWQRTNPLAHLFAAMKEAKPDARPGPAVCGFSDRLGLVPELLTPYPASLSPEPEAIPGLAL